MKLLVMVGVPGSGKSTIAASLVDVIADCFIVNPDSIREQVTGDATDQSQNGLVWRLAYEEINAKLFIGHNVILDATSLTPKERKKALEVARKHNATCYAYIVDVPHDVCTLRNTRRDRVVPEDVMQRMFDRFNANCSTATLQTEGFQVIRPVIGEK